VILPIQNQTVHEGEMLEVHIGATDPDSDKLLMGANHLPPGATFDSAERVLRWQTDATSAGRYSDVEVFASDGINLTARTFEILVLNANQAPQLDPVADRTLREGESVQFQLVAHDVDGDTVRFSSPNLPRGAILVPGTGLFAWTPGYDQHGSYQIEFVAS